MFKQIHQSNFVEYQLFINSDCLNQLIIFLNQSLSIHGLSTSKKKIEEITNTTKSNIKADTGNKAIIESIDKKSARVIFDTDDLKEKILKGDENPLTTGYVVDVKVENVKDKLAAYKVMVLHETFQLDENV